MRERSIPKGTLYFPDICRELKRGKAVGDCGSPGRHRPKSLMAFFGKGFFSDFVYEKSDWDYKTFQVDADLKAANEKTAQALNATDPDLKPFKARGGKLIVYHGWNDPAISALNTVNYYQSVIAKMGQKEARLFRPAVHGAGRAALWRGPRSGFVRSKSVTGVRRSAHSVEGALEQWVEKGTAPSTIIASKFEGQDRTHARDDAPAMPLSAGSEVQRERRYERRVEFFLSEIREALNHEGH